MQFAICTAHINIFSWLSFLMEIHTSKMAEISSSHFDEWNRAFVKLLWNDNIQWRWKNRGYLLNTYPRLVRFQIYILRKEIDVFVVEKPQKIYSHDFQWKIFQIQFSILKRLEENRKLKEKFDIFWYLCCQIHLHRNLRLFFTHTRKTVVDYAEDVIRYYAMSYGKEEKKNVE